jgi:hypothetical protein
VNLTNLTVAGYAGVMSTFYKTAACAWPRHAQRNCLGEDFVF